MKIITISREFGSGGREIGKRLADYLGYDYYDREILTAIAENKGYDTKYVEGTLERNNMASIVPLHFGSTFAYASVSQTRTELLIEQKKVIENIAKEGRDCIIVGRNADVILADYHPYSIFVCADMESRVKRSMLREEGGLTAREIERNVKRIDRERAKLRAMITDSPWGSPTSYNLTINTTGNDVKKLARDLSDFLAAQVE